MVRLVGELLRLVLPAWARRTLWIAEFDTAEREGLPR
jgi:hypothetical protein